MPEQCPYGRPCLAREALVLMPAFPGETGLFSSVGMDEQRNAVVAHRACGLGGRSRRACLRAEKALPEVRLKV